MCGRAVWRVCTAVVAVVCVTRRAPSPRRPVGAALGSRLALSIHRGSHVAPRSPYAMPLTTQHSQALCDRFSSQTLHTVMNATERARRRRRIQYSTSTVEHTGHDTGLSAPRETVRQTGRQRKVTQTGRMAWLGEASSLEAVSCHICACVPVAVVVRLGSCSSSRICRRRSSCRNLGRW